MIVIAGIEIVVIVMTGTGAKGTGDGAVEVGRAIETGIGVVTGAEVGAAAAAAAAAGYHAASFCMHGYARMIIHARMHVHDVHMYTHTCTHVIACECVHVSLC